jgi:hypothetical protein
MHRAPGGKAREEYDALGRLRQIRDPEQYLASLQYDAGGWLGAGPRAAVGPVGGAEVLDGWGLGDFRAFHRPPRSRLSRLATETPNSNSRYRGRGPTAFDRRRRWREPLHA